MFCEITSRKTTFIKNLSILNHICPYVSRDNYKKIDVICTFMKWEVLEPFVLKGLKFTK